MRIKGISSLLLAVLFSLTGYAHDVESNKGKSGYLTETFSLFPLNSNKQLLQWDSDLGQVTSRKSPSDLPFTLKFSRQQPEPEQLGAAIMPVPLAIRDFGLGQLPNNSSVSPGPSWYSFPTASMATFPLPQLGRRPPRRKTTFDWRMGVLGGALIGAGVYLIATSEKQFGHKDPCLFFCPPPCTSGEQPGCFTTYDDRMPGGILTAGLGVALVVLGFYWP